MTDQDFWPRSVPGEWKKVGRAIAGATSEDVIARFRQQALAASLRQNGGCRLFEEIADALETNLYGSPERWQSAVDDIRRRSGFDVHTRCALDAAMALRERPDALLFAGSDELRQQLAERTVVRLSRRYEDTAVRRVTGEAPTMPPTLDDESVRYFARALRERPDGAGIKAPRRQRKRAGTAALLRRVIGRGEEK
jgi:hypothetical protein